MFGFEVFDNKKPTVHKKVNLIDLSIYINNDVCLFKGFKGEMNDELLFFKKSKFLELTR